MSTLPRKWAPSAIATRGDVMSPSTDPPSRISTFSDAETLRLTQANAKRLPFGSGRFDRVVSVEMLEHVFRPDRDAVFAEIARVLRPGGRVAVATPNTASPIEVAKRVLVRWPGLRRRLPSACFPEATDDAATYHPYRYHHPLPRREIVDRLGASGLRVLGSRRTCRISL
jgi:SAM-dependent methyltransferase